MEFIKSLITLLKNLVGLLSECKYRTSVSHKHFVVVVRVRVVSPLGFGGKQWTRMPHFHVQKVKNSGKGHRVTP